MNAMPATLITSLKEYLNSRKKVIELLIKEFEVKYGSLDKLRKKLKMREFPKMITQFWDELIMWEKP